MRISSSITDCSRAISSVANFGSSTLSPSTSKAFGRCSSSTRVLKHTISFAVNASSMPPTRSTSRAMSSAVRRLVPWKTMCSMKCEMPFRSAGSRRDPDRSHIPTDTEWTCSIGSVITTRPLGNTSFRTVDLFSVMFTFYFGTPPLGKSCAWPQRFPEGRMHFGVTIYFSPRPGAIAPALAEVFHASGGPRLLKCVCYDCGKMSSQATRLAVDLLGKSLEELRVFLETLGEPAYRGAQIYHALYRERRFDLAKITNLPASLRQRLPREAAIALPRIVRRYRSADGTVRYVLAMGAEAAFTGATTSPARERGVNIETVFMPEENRQTICISTQAGCAVDCQFCLTATLGLVRNLSAGEIVGQVLVALDDNREALKPQTNIVLMGQ